MSPGRTAEKQEQAAPEGLGLLVILSVLLGFASISTDLYLPSQWAGEDVVQDPPAGGAGAEFGPCVDVVAAPPAADVAPSVLTGLVLDPLTQAGLDAIAALQQRVVDVCEATQSLVALLDVPPDLSLSRIERWRAAFDSAWAAAYHPWLIPTRRHDDDEDVATNRPRRLPPSAVAAGIVARRERTYGLPYGPANEVANSVIHVAEAQPPGRADVLQPLSINCFVRRQEGIALVAARTLARDGDWRQLSVRRMVLMIRRALVAQTQWAVFEPNNERLWGNLRRTVEDFLFVLWRDGALLGSKPEEAYFVRCDRSTMTQNDLDNGRLICLVGVAPVRPAEFVIFRVGQWTADAK